MKVRVLLFPPGQWRDLADALRFLTRLSIPGPGRDPAGAMGAFPLAGAVVGTALVILDWALGLTGLPPGTRDALLVAALAWLTGGLHLDGLMDTLDGLYGGHTPEERLAIMRDSRVGSVGVLGGVCILLIKVAALGALHGGARAEALIVAPMLGRWAMLPPALLFVPARPDGLGAAFHAGATPRRLARAASTCLLFAVAVGSPALAAFALCSGAAWLLGGAISARIGGLTGDSFGAICEVTETLALLVLAAG